MAMNDDLHAQQMPTEQYAAVAVLSAHAEFVPMNEISLCAWPAPPTATWIWTIHSRNIHEKASPLNRID